MLFGKIQENVDALKANPITDQGKFEQWWDEQLDIYIAELGTLQKDSLIEPFWTAFLTEFEQALDNCSPFIPSLLAKIRNQFKDQDSHGVSEKQNIQKIKVNWRFNTTKTLAENLLHYLSYPAFLKPAGHESRPDIKRLFEYLPIFCGFNETYILFPIEKTAIDQFKLLAEKLPSLHSALDPEDFTEEVKAMNLDQLDPDQALQNWWQAQLKLIDNVMQEHMQEMLDKIFPVKTTPQARAEQEYLLKSAYIYAFLEVLMTNAQINDIFTTTVLSCFSQKIQEKEYAKWFDKQINQLAKNFSGATLEEWNSDLDVFVESLGGKDSLLKAAVPKLKEQFNSIEKVNSNWRLDENKSSQENFLHYLSNLKLITFTDIGRIFDDLEAFAGTAEYYTMFNLPLAAYEEFKNAAHNLSALHPDISEENAQQYFEMTLSELDSDAEFSTWWVKYGPTIDMHFYSISGRMLDTLFPVEKGQKAMYLREEGPLREGYLGVLFALFRRYANPQGLIDPATTKEQTLVDYVTKNLSQLPSRHGMSLTNQHLDALHELIDALEFPADRYTKDQQRQLKTAFRDLQTQLLKLIDDEPIEFDESKTALFEKRLLQPIISSTLPSALKLFFIESLINFAHENKTPLFEHQLMKKERVALFQSGPIFETKLLNKEAYLRINIPLWDEKINAWLKENKLAPVMIPQEPKAFNFSIIEKILPSLTPNQKIIFLRFCKDARINTDTSYEGNFLYSINNALRKLMPASKSQIELAGHIKQILVALNLNPAVASEMKLLSTAFLSDETSMMQLSKPLADLFNLLDTGYGAKENAIFLASEIKKINAPAVLKMFIAESIHKSNPDNGCFDTSVLINQLSKDLQPALFLENAIYDLVTKKLGSSPELIPHFAAWQADLTNKDLIKAAFAMSPKAEDLAQAMLDKLKTAPVNPDGKKFEQTIIISNALYDVLRANSMREKSDASSTKSRTSSFISKVSSIGSKKSGDSDSKKSVSSDSITSSSSKGKEKEKESNSSEQESSKTSGFAGFLKKGSSPKPKSNPNPSFEQKKS